MDLLAARIERRLRAARDRADRLRRLLPDGAALLRARGGSRVASFGSLATGALALAFEVERWYSAAEALLERIVRAVDGDVPAGPTWHVELLRAAQVAVDELRPAMVSRAESLDAFDAWLRAPSDS